MEQEWLCKRVYRTHRRKCELMAAKISHRILTVVMLIAAALTGCNNAAPVQPPPPPAPESLSTFTINGSVREMVIVPETPEFPEHPGKGEFVMYCGVCHSLRYISTQPDFSKKVWKAEVKKMVEKYGAPIDSVNCQKI